MADGRCLHDLRVTPVGCEMFEITLDKQHHRKKISLKQGEIFCITCWMKQEEVRSSSGTVIQT